jgi:hypothetical protein
MNNVESKCIDLFKKINWDEVGKGENYNHYFSLLIEFFRRATILADKHNIVCNSPWEVIGKIMPTGYRLSSEVENTIENISNKSSNNRVYISLTLLTFTLFEEAKELGIIPQHEKNIYSPLLKMFELTGAFHTHHGFIEFNDLSQIQIFDRKWIDCKRDEPYVEFDEYF